MSEAAFSPNDDRVVMSSDDVLELKRLFLQEPTIRSCVRILQSAVLASGIQLTRGGGPVALKPSFERHLNEYWLAFARDILTAVLVTGIAPVILAKKPTPAFGVAPKPNEDKNLIPLVADFAVTQVAIERIEMVRTYALETAQGDPIDNSHVFVKAAPNRFGVPDSAMLSLREPLLFMQALNAHALDAEKVRSRLLITTELHQKTGKPNENLEYEQLFADAESRQIAQGNEQADSHKQHANLVLASKLAQEYAACSTLHATTTKPCSSHPSKHKQAQPRANVARRRWVGQRWWWRRRRQAAERHRAEPRSTRCEPFT